MLFKKHSGFTLIELLVVVLIIGILAAIAWPQYEQAVEMSRAAEGITLARNIALANQRYLMAHGTWSENIHRLDLTFPGEDTSTGSADVLSKNTKYFSCRARGNIEATAHLISVCRRRGPKYTYAIVYNKSNPDQAVCWPDGSGDRETQKKMCSLLTGKDEKPYTF